MVAMRPQGCMLVVLGSVVFLLVCFPVLARCRVHELHDENEDCLDDDDDNEVPEDPCADAKTRYRRKVKKYNECRRKAGLDGISDETETQDDDNDEDIDLLPPAKPAKSVGEAEPIRLSKPLPNKPPKYLASPRPGPPAPLPPGGFEPEPTPAPLDGPLPKNCSNDTDPFLCRNIHVRFECMERGFCSWMEEGICVVNPFDCCKIATEEECDSLPVRRQFKCYWDTKYQKCLLGDPLAPAIVVNNVGTPPARGRPVAGRER